MELSVERRQWVGRVHAQQHRSSSSEERRKHWQEVHWQQVRLIRQQDSDDRRSQSLGLAEWSAEQHVKCNSIPARPSAWNTMYVLVITFYLVQFHTLNVQAIIGYFTPSLSLSPSEVMECMACSDNVVRAGLTPKYRDKDTLCKMLTYDTKPPSENKFQPRQHPSSPNVLIYDPPTPEFSVARITIPPGINEFTLPVTTGMLWWWHPRVKMACCC